MRTTMNVRAQTGLGTTTIGATVVALSTTLLGVSPVRAETYYFHTDHLGTPQAVTDSTGTVAWQGSYDPFGNATETVADVEQNLRLPGQYLERETGLHQNWFRDYDPRIGRYVESDPIGLDGGLSTYGYAFQNPVKYTDPSGLITPLGVGLYAACTAGVAYNTSSAVSSIAAVTSEQITQITLQIRDVRRRKAECDIGDVEKYALLDELDRSLSEQRAQMLIEVGQKTSTTKSILTGVGVQLLCTALVVAL